MRAWIFDGVFDGSLKSNNKWRELLSAKLLSLRCHHVIASRKLPCHILEPQYLQILRWSDKKRSTLLVVQTRNSHVSNSAFRESDREKGKPPRDSSPKAPQQSFDKPEFVNQSSYLCFSLLKITCNLEHETNETDRPDHKTGAPRWPRRICWANKVLEAGSNLRIIILWAIPTAWNFPHSIYQPKLSVFLLISNAKRSNHLACKSQNSTPKLG